ncbi:MAG: DUF1330 domain-containing protein [Azospirillaceae bacterium]|nr:DUF1330 domain-containing protein [Azospirillaceae bacterium]
MTAYVVFIKERIKDQAELDLYASKVPAARAGHAMTPLARYGTLEVLEGPAMEGALIASFPTMEEAKAWYHSPAYQEAAQHRFAGADYRVFIVEGV